VRRFRGDLDVQDAIHQRLYRISDAASQLSDTSPNTAITASTP
jgi:hypothetical protein